MANPKGNPQNLTPGNPKATGRPPDEFSLTAIAKKILQAKEGDDAELAEQIVRDWMKNARSGNGTALNSLLDRIDGPVKQVIRIEDIPDERLLELLRKLDNET